MAETEFDAGEKIEPLEYSFDEFLALGSNTDMREMILRLRLLEAQLDEDKRNELYNLLYARKWKFDTRYVLLYYVTNYQSILFIRCCVFFTAESFGRT